MHINPIIVPIINKCSFFLFCKIDIFFFKTFKKLFLIVADYVVQYLGVCALQW